MIALPDWMYPPREEGWFAEDLDHLPEAPRHTELSDGSFVFTMRPRGRWHEATVTELTLALKAQAPVGLKVGRELGIRLDAYNRPESDLLVTTADFDTDRTCFVPDEVRLVIEVESPESAYRDRTVKLRKYAEAGIPHYWRIEDEDGSPVVHVYELDEPTASYSPAGVFRHVLERPVPFEINLDLDKLAPPQLG